MYHNYACLYVRHSTLAVTPVPKRSHFARQTIQNAADDLCSHLDSAKVKCHDFAFDDNRLW